MRQSFILLSALALSLCLGSCKKGNEAGRQEPEENRQAKQMLQGIWVDEDEQDVAFKAKGDTIFYPDSTSQPVYFQIIADSLVLRGANVSKYAIVKQTGSLFIFKNQNGDEVKLVRSDDPDDAAFFSVQRPQPLNQGTVIKRDTVLMFNEEKYHCYVQVNPTTYKVISQSYNDEGVGVDNVYYDNIINLNVYHGAQKLFGGDFRKQQFKGKVPDQYLKQSILSDMTLKACDSQGIHYIASLIIPGTNMSSYQVEVIVAYNGKLSIK